MYLKLLDDVSDYSWMNVVGKIKVSVIDFEYED